MGYFFMTQVILMVLIVTLRICAQKRGGISIFNKVDARFPDDFHQCFVAEHKNVMNPVLCAGLCVKNPECYLFCIQGRDCLFYNARVSWHWKGIKSNKLPSRQCFSSWGNLKDAIPSSTFSSTPRHLKWPGEPEMAANGYACITDFGYAYGSREVNKPWWAANLGVTRIITAVRILTRVKKGSPAWFINVEIRVGFTNSENGDFTANPLLAYSEGKTLSRQTLFFKAENPMLGSIVSIQSVNNTIRLLLADVQILYEDELQ